MDLRSRLLRADKHRRPAVSFENLPRSVPDTPLDVLLKGEWVERDVGRCLLIRESFPLDYQHGNLCLGELLALPQGIWSPFFEADSPALDVRRTLFIDTETTGLRRGSSVAFLVGVGFFTSDAFCLEQYFMPDYGDEGALLELLADKLARHQGLISFNGRAFDWPILQTRYILTRRVPPKVEGPHLDLLMMARRLWRHRLASCSLGSLEAHVLELERTDQDVPGYLIPQLYEDYVRRGHVGPMADVIYHNAIDVLSMVSLATQVGRLLLEPAPPPSLRLYDPVALGRMYERVGVLDHAIGWYRLGQACEDEAVGQAADRHLSLVYKRLGRHREAVAIWERRLGGDEPYPYIELAKHLEHRERDYARALRVVEQAIERLTCGNGSGATDRHLLAELEHRRKRLVRRRRTAKALQAARGEDCTT